MNIIKQLIIIAFSAFIVLFLSSCKQRLPEHGHEHPVNILEEDTHRAAHKEEGIRLSKEQINTMNITFGQFSQIKINDFVRATGTLGLPPNAMTSVSAKASGFIKNSNKYVEGSYVKKGVIMAQLENPEFIRQQQEYLEVEAQLIYLRQDLDRQQKLVDANAGVVRKLQKLQSEVKIKTATVKGIAKQLTYLGINVSALSPDNIVERIAIVSPMSGYITSIKMHNGMYVEPSTELMEIVNENHLHLELDVFEKDIVKIKEGQKISYIVPALGSETYEGEVHVLGKEFDTENKTVRIHGHLENARPQFIKDLFVEAKIWLTDQTVQALPETAIVKDGSSSYIYVVNEKVDGDEVKFEQVMVIPGSSDKGFTSVKLVNETAEGMKIVTDGAYYVYAQSKAGELEHKH